jgi:multiple sugar transport system substrate-binding protein
VRSTSASERSNFIALEKRFNLEHPQIKIKFITYRTAQYKQLISHWLSSNTGPDVLFWHAGERLQQFVRNNYVANLDDMWRDNELNYSFAPSLINLISHDGSQYAVPITYYHWGFYYNRNLFNDLSISPPDTWQQFIQLCLKLKKLKINPISLGSSELWPLAA